VSLDPELDALSNSLVEIEQLIAAPAQDSVIAPPDAPPLTLAKMLYFGVPRNDKLLGYWDTVADRLFKIRHCMSIAGIVRPLALFDPPIDPGMLDNLVGGGIAAGATVIDTVVREAWEEAGIRAEVEWPLRFGHVQDGSGQRPIRPLEEGPQHAPHADPCRSVTGLHRRRSVGGDRRANPTRDPCRLEARVRVARRPVRSRAAPLRAGRGARGERRRPCHGDGHEGRRQQSRPCPHRSLDRRPWNEGASLDLAIGARSRG